MNLFNANQWVNGQPQPIQPMVQSAMFYPNTYINFTQAGEYTKHYYNGTERICSRLGEQQISISVENDQEWEAHRHDVKEMLRNAIGQHLYDEPTDMQEGEVLHLEYLQPCGNSNAIYYYHPNHLSSTMYVTDMQQSVVQSFLYAPYGEIISEYNTHAMGDAFPKYAFNAKELDEETGMYYYEARYYAPPTFTSRDPLFEKYFWISPYAYCANNPVKYVDPSGDSIDVSGLSNEQLEIYKNSINELKNSPLFAYYYRGLHNSSTKYTIQAGPGYGGSGSFDSETNTISANLNNLYSLSQEMFHAYQQDCAFYTSDDGSVRETEGDLMAMLVLTDISKYSISFGVEWAIPFNDYLYDEYRESFFDKEFVNVFDHLVDERIKYYLTTKDPPETYIQPNSHKSPQALLNVLKNVSYQYQQWKSNPKSRPNLGIIVTGKKINK